jgi:hypothetical protein
MIMIMDREIKLFCVLHAVINFLLYVWEGKPFKQGIQKVLINF